jgi:hypothetical protein
MNVIDGSRLIVHYQTGVLNVGRSGKGLGILQLRRAVGR